MLRPPARSVLLLLVTNDNAWQEETAHCSAISKAKKETSLIEFPTSKKAIVVTVTGGNDKIKTCHETPQRPQRRLFLLNAPSTTTTTTTTTRMIMIPFYYYYNAFAEAVPRRMFGITFAAKRVPTARFNKLATIVARRDDQSNASRLNGRCIWWIVAKQSTWKCR